jgi:nucleoside-diphosphate-sugar epimerase
MASVSFSGSTVRSFGAASTCGSAAWVGQSLVVGALFNSSARIRRELGWKPQYPDLHTIVEHAWEWHRTHPHGYGD